MRTIAETGHANGAEGGAPPRALALTGLLGAGKTTLLLALVEELAARGARVAVVENERGSVGVDGPYLEARGVRVREIRTGCVCCDLALPLRWTIETLVRAHRPDWLLLEASGVADMDALRAGLAHPDLADLGLDWRVLAAIDVARFAKLWSEPYGLGAIVRRQITGADLLALTKADTVSAHRLATARAATRTLRPDLRPLIFGADDPGSGAAALADLEEHLWLEEYLCT